MANAASQWPSGVPLLGARPGEYNQYPDPPDGQRPPMYKDNSEEGSARPVYTVRQYSVPFFLRLPALVIAICSAGLASYLFVWLFIRRYDGPDGGIVRVGSGGPAFTVLEPTKASSGKLDPKETLLIGLIISSVLASALQHSRLLSLTFN